MANNSFGNDVLSLPVAVLLGSIIIGGSIIYTGSRQPSVVAQAPKPSAPTQTVTAANIKSVKTAGAKIVGSPTAPVVVAYWYDYQCGFCKQNELTTMSQVMAEYVNTGKIRVVFKDLQFLGADSNTMGLASAAVWEVAPAKWYDWHRKIMENQGRNGSGWASDENIKSLTASVLGQTDAGRVVSLMKSKASTYQAQLDADKAEGSKFNLRSTPSMIVGGVSVIGAKPYTEVKSAIEAALKK